MSLRKPSELFENKVAEEKNLSPAKKYLNDSYQEFEGNLFKIEELGEKIEAIYTEYPKTLEILSEKLKNRVTKTDLDKAMFTHLSVVDENFQDIKNQIKGVNKKDLKEFKDGVSLLTSIVENLVDVELPRYKNKVTGNEIKISDKLAESEKKVAKDLIESEIKISDKLAESEKKVAKELSQLSFFIEEKVDQFGETKKDLLKIAETYKKLHTVISNKYTEENEKIKEYSNVLEDFNTRVNDFTNDVENKISNYEDYITNQKDFLLDDINKLKKEIKSDVADIKADVVVYERHVDKIEGYIQDNKKDLADLKENVIKDITNILNGDVQINITRLEKKINDIREKYDAIKPEEIMQDIQEGLVNIPSNVKNSDPLTPLDQNYVTTKQLQDHYRLFLNRIQQQLSTLGGGGETRLQYLDDIVGIATNIDEYDGKFLSYDSAIGKFEFKTVSGGGGSGITTAEVRANTLTVTGISTFTGNINANGNIIGDNATNITGINNVSASTLTGTLQTAAQPNITSVGTLGSLNVSGDVSIGGTLTYEDVTNVDSIGIITARSGIQVLTGTATTALVVDGDAVVTGILTIGSSSLKLDGDNNVVNVGTALTLGHSQGIQFHTQNLHATGFEVNQINVAGFVTATAFKGDLEGNSETTSKLVNPVNIGGISFDGSSSINLPGVNVAGNQNTSGTAAGLSGSPDINVSNIVGTSSSISGISSASAFADFDYLQAPHGGTTTFTVTVASKSNHRYNGGSGSAYYINGVESPVLTLTPGRTYRFTNDNTGSHPFKFYYKADKSSPGEYTTNVTSANSYTEITITDTTPNVLHYQCGNHELMGNSIITNSNVVDTPYDASIYNQIKLRSNDNTSARIDLYCESNNAHYLRLQAPPHSSFSGNPTVILPNIAGDIIVGDTASAIDQDINTTGDITATSFSGSGVNLTGLTGASADTYGDSGSVPVIVVDANGRITGISTAAVSGGGGGGGVTVQDEGSALSTTGTTLNFVGDGVVASGTGATKTITISGGGGVTVKDEGSALSTTGTTLNFVGSGVVASGTGAEKTITIAGGASQDVFKTIAVSGQSDVVADGTTDTLTLVAGSNMTITTNAGSDTITFASSGGGGGGGSGPDPVIMGMIF